MSKFITHVALYCRDLERSAAWYQRIFGMHLRASASGRFAALSFGHKHHDFALVQAPPEFEDGGGRRVGLYHIAIDTGGFTESVSIFRRARAEGAEYVKAIDHRLGNGLYLRDPDGNILELWSESYPSMDEALAALERMDPPFEQNPIGFPLDIDRTLASGEPVHADGQTAPSPITHR